MPHQGDSVPTPVFIPPLELVHKLPEPEPEPESVEVGRRWSAAQLWMLGTLFVASGCGMVAAGPGTMCFGIFGMSSDAQLGLSGADISRLLSVGSAGFSLGKLVGGPVSDRLGGKHTLLVILSLMGGCMVVMGRSSNHRTITGAWFATRMAHALTWCGVMLVARPWFLGNGESAALSILTASCPTGAFLGAAVGGRFLEGSGWRRLVSGTGLLTLAAAATQLTLRSGPSHSAGYGGIPPQLEGKPGARASATLRSRDFSAGQALGGMQATRIILRSPKLWAVYICSTLITPTLDLPTLLPMFLGASFANPRNAVIPTRQQEHYI